MPLRDKELVIFTTFMFGTGMHLIFIGCIFIVLRETGYSTSYLYLVDKKKQTHIHCIYYYIEWGKIKFTIVHMENDTIIVK